MPGPAWPVAAAARAVADGGFCRALRASDTRKAGRFRVPLLGEEELLQLGKIRRGDVGNCAERKAILLPGEPVVALGFAGATPVAFGLGLFHENINDVFAARVDKGGDSFPRGYIEASAKQRKSLAGE